MQTVRYGFEKGRYMYERGKEEVVRHYVCEKGKLRER